MGRKKLLSVIKQVCLGWQKGEERNGYLKDIIQLRHLHPGNDRRGYLEDFLKSLLPEHLRTELNATYHQTFEVTFLSLLAVLSS
jgi:hypothetical protein